MNLSDKDREILQTWLDVWAANDLLLAGDISYAAVVELAERLGLGIPPELDDIRTGEFERRMKETIKHGRD